MSDYKYDKDRIYAPSMYVTKGAMFEDMNGAIRHLEEKVAYYKQVIICAENAIPAENIDRYMDTVPKNDY